MNRPDKFYFDWWNIRKSTIYLIVAALLFFALFGGAIWAWRAGYFQSKTEKAEAPKDAARIVSFEGDVRVVRAATRETILVTRETTFVSAGDTIQTQADGKAQVQMIDGSILNVRPNSTVVIRDSASIFGGTNVRVALDNGQMNVRTQDQSEQTQNVVEMNESESELAAQTDASFNNNGGAGGEIRISRGSVETNTGGEKVLIKEGEFASVQSGKISARERLLVAPKPLAPGAGEQIPTGADVSFRWLKPESSSAVNYHLQISKSQSFAPDQIVQERTALAAQIFNVSGLAPGIYYWRLRAGSASGQASDWSEFWKFTVTRDAANAQLAATEWQVERIGGNVYRLSGKTQPGTNARAAGRETFADAGGSFTLQISSPSQSVTIELSDERGNRARYNLSLATGNAVRTN
jgi:hypothetical protein